MNKQPFYHCAELLGEDRISVLMAISKIKGVIKSSIELNEDDENGSELLFTATRDCCSEANDVLIKLKKRKLIKSIPCPVYAEPGDPCDLM